MAEVLAYIVKSMIAAASIFIGEVESSPDYRTVMSTLTAIHGDIKATAITTQTTATAVQAM